MGNKQERLKLEMVWQWEIPSGNKNSNNLYNFEVAMVLRSSLLLWSLLLNSEALVNLSDKDIRWMYRLMNICWGQSWIPDEEQTTHLNFLKLVSAQSDSTLWKEDYLHAVYFCAGQGIYDLFKATLENPLKNDVWELVRNI